MDLIAHLALMLNARGIVPDVVTFEAPHNLTPEGVNAAYGVDAKFRVRLLHGWKKRLPGELHIWGFNNQLRMIRNDYHLFINLSNTDAFSPNHPTILYVQYPRKARALSRYTNIHAMHPKAKPKVGRAALLDLLVRLVYSLRRAPNGATQVVCNSEFTRRRFGRVYPYYARHHSIRVIYPTYVDTGHPIPPLSRKSNSVIHIGRFSESKSQRELVVLASSVPSVEFFLVGFARHGDRYLAKCREARSQSGAQNVRLFVNATAADRQRLLDQSKVYLHSTRNEPFGLGVLHGIVLGGCIPLVPNSGGQREIVPIEALRYESLSELPTKLSALLTDPTRQARYRSELLAKAKVFEFSAFCDNWNSLLETR